MKKQGFLRGSAILLAMVFVTKAIGLAYKIPLTHMLGGSGMAYYSGTFAVFSPLLAAVVSGISASVARLTAESYAFERYAQLKKVHRTALIVYSLEGLAAALLFVLLSLPLAKSFLHESSAAWALCAVAPTVLFSAVLSVMRGYYEGLHNMLPTARSEIIETVIKAVLGLAAAYSVLFYARREFARSHGCFGSFYRTEEDALSAALPYAAAGAILAGSLATGFAALYIAISGRRHSDAITPAQLAADRKTDSTAHIVKSLFSYSLPMAGAAVITTLTGTIDLLTVSQGVRTALSAGMVTEISVSADKLPDFMYGSYTGLALMVSGLIPTFTAMFGKSSVPALTEAYAQGDRRALSEQVRAMLKVTALTAFPFATLICTLPRELLSFLFAGRTDEIVAAALPLGVLGIACVFSSFALPCIAALQTLGCRAAPIALMLLSAGVKLAGDLLLIPLPQLGLTGAAIAAVAAQGVIAFPAVVLLLRRTDTPPDISAFVKPLFASLLAACAAFTLNSALGRLPLPLLQGRISFLAVTAFGAAVYFSALWLMDALPKAAIRKYFFKKFRKTY